MEVFNKTGYDNVNGWDGTNSSNGKELPDGAYFYIITSPDFPTVYTGSINLIRTK